MFLSTAQKDNAKEKSTPVKQQKEKIMCAEILNLTGSFKETVGQILTHNLFWDVLPKLTTTLNIETKETKSIYNNNMNDVCNHIFGKSGNYNNEEI